MCKQMCCGLLAFSICLALPAATAAQEKMPNAGSTAVGIDVGTFMPTDDELDGALTFGAIYEYYLTPRLSVRTNLGWADPGFKREKVDSLRQMPLRLDLNYNWERVKWHPFVGAGVGAYFLQLKDNNEAFGQSETKAGFSLGGGVEYFTSRTVAIKGEGRYHKVAGVRGGLDPSGTSLTLGLKKYF